MSIFDRSTGSRIRNDAAQFADEIAKRLPDFDRTRDQAADAVHDAADQARHQIDRAAEMARTIRDDIAHSADTGAADNPIDEIGQRIRAVASTPAVQGLISRIEKGLPESDRDKVQRAYTRGRTQARSKYLVIGIVAGVGAGAVAAILLDPEHGKERRAAITHRISSLGRNAGDAIAGKAKLASDRARGLAIERGVIKPPATEPVEAPMTPVFADGPVTDPSSTAWERLPSGAGGAVPAGDLATPAAPLDAAGDHGTAPSIHG